MAPISPLGHRSTSTFGLCHAFDSPCDPHFRRSHLDSPAVPPRREHSHPSQHAIPPTGCRLPARIRRSRTFDLDPFRRFSHFSSPPSHLRAWPPVVLSVDHTGVASSETISNRILQGGHLLLRAPPTLFSVIFHSNSSGTPLIFHVDPLDPSGVSRAPISSMSQSWEIRHSQTLFSRSPFPSRPLLCPVDRHHVNHDQMKPFAGHIRH